MMCEERDNLKKYCSGLANITGNNVKELKMCGLN